MSQQVFRATVCWSVKKRSSKTCCFKWISLQESDRMFLLVGCFCLALSKTALCFLAEKSKVHCLSPGVLNTLQISLLETHYKREGRRKNRKNVSLFAIAVFAQTSWHVKSERECMGGQNRATTGASLSICFAAVHLLVCYCLFVSGVIC